jgi:4-amino-4-deoxy-L-arabinose transferase-like glycosyltransferase
MLKTKYLIIIILLIASAIRLWQLGNVPSSLDWDEAALGYNALSILQTGKDEYGNTLPIMLKSFGDYKPALYSYFAIPSVAIFGLSDFAVRLPSAILGLIAVLATFFLVRELLRNEKLALIASFILAISPWHIQFSRTAFEANLGLTLNILTALFFLKGLKKPYLLIASAITSGLSVYSYQSEKIFAPLFILTLILIFRKDLIGIGRKYVLAFLAVGLIVAAPLYVSAFINPESLNRVRATNFANDDKFHPHRVERQRIDIEMGNFVGMFFDSKLITYSRQALGSYISHFDPNWLFIQGDLERHHAPSMGLLYHWELPFVLLGLYFMVFSPIFPRKSKILIFSWFFLAPLPASITNDVPHAVRTLNFLPTFQILTATGLFFSYQWLKSSTNKSVLIRGALISFTLIFLLNFIFYINQYFVQQNYSYSHAWQYGYEEAVGYIDQIREDYDKVIVSNDVPLDQSHIFFLYHMKYDPKKYQETYRDLGSYNFENLEFRKIDWEKDKNIENVVLVGSPGDFKEEGKVLKSVKYINGEEAIRIVEPL